MRIFHVNDQAQLGADADSVAGRHQASVADAYNTISYVWRAQLSITLWWVANLCFCLSIQIMLCVFALLFNVVHSNKTRE